MVDYLPIVEISDVTMIAEVYIDSITNNYCVRTIVLAVSKLLTWKLKVGMTFCCLLEEGGLGVTDWPPSLSLILRCG
jgi:hypothetical protein